MSERTSSFLILLGGTLAILAVWALSVLAIRWDSRRRAMTEMERNIWVGLAVALPLFGFALYLAMRVMRGYMAPPPVEETPDDARLTAVRVREAQNPAHAPSLHNTHPPQQMPGDTSTNVFRPPAPRFSLVALEGPHLGQQFVLSRFPARIGRGSDADVPLDADLNVSRRHAEVYEWYGALRVRDLQSTHGTLVNDVAINDQPVAPGDRIKIGGSVLIVREVSEW